MTTTSTTDREITATRIFDAPRELVFRMWTEPEHVAKWWGPNGFTTTVHKMEVRPGGAWELTLHGPDGTDYPNRIVYREVVPPERLAYSHISGPPFEFTATFEDLGGGRTQVFVRMLFESAELRDNVIKTFGAAEGLNQTLDRLGERLAGGIE